MQDQKLRTLTGLVMGRSGDKSVKVAIDYKIRHPKYGKYVRRRTKVAVHDDRNQSGVGDIIEIAQCRPHSKTKRWRLVKVVTRASQA
ncbi:MAG TPA: 30S ribosomal protein S17 [Sedimentisphaerales bacterium]|jgi:small subunit ribosomal protein S17|nr:30S ribosomal protein S17 [Sedimentisphaerales bacterium]